MHIFSWYVFDKTIIRLIIKKLLLNKWIIINYIVGVNVCTSNKKQQNTAQIEQ